MATLISRPHPLVIAIHGGSGRSHAPAKVETEAAVVCYFFDAAVYVQYSSY